MRMRIRDIFGRLKELDVSPTADFLLEHESGRIYDINGELVQLAGTYNWPTVTRTTGPIIWERKEKPVFFESAPTLGKLER